MSTAFPARLERFGMVDSTQTIVRRWLDAGTPEVAVAVADQQTAGRGRLDRTWTAPAGAALLCSVGLRPDGLDAGHGWRLGAVVSLAMLDAAEEVAGLRDGRLQLKWPNDIVIDGATTGDPGGPPLRKVAGVLGESVLTAEGTIETAVVGIGVNADWAAADFPAALAATMTSLREASGGRPIDRDRLLDAFLARLEPRYAALQAGRFDAGTWTARQVTTGREVEVATGDRHVRGRATGVDPESGSLIVEVEGREWSVESGEVTHCRVLG
jgi:BirA family transcriptional regulator, biotin operon repressor / biotin---[acetyl-CoA-carboxylase] ligase